MNIKDIEPYSLAYLSFKDLYCRDCGLIPYEKEKSGYGLSTIEDFNSWEVIDRNVNLMHSLCPTCIRKKKIEKLRNGSH